MHACKQDGWRIAFAVLSLLGASGEVSGLELRVFHENPQVMTEIHREVARRLNVRRPDVEVTVSSVADYSEMLTRNLREAITGDPPDVAFHGHNNIGILVARGLLAPLDPFIAAEGNWSEQGFPPALQEVGKIDGKAYAIPFTLSIPVVYYNLDHVRRAGGDPDNLPRSWPEIIALGRKIEAPSGGIFFTYNSTGSWTFMGLIQSLGGRILTERGDVAFEGPEGLEAMRVLAEIGRARGGADMTQPQARQSFSAGALGIMVDTSSRLATYERDAQGKFELRAVPFPLAGRADARLPPSGTSATILAADPAKRQAAWDYIKVATSPEMQSYMVEKTGFLPGNALAVQREDLLGPFVRSRPNWRAAVDRVPALTFWTAFPGENSVRIHREITDELREIVTLKRSPEEGLARLAATVRALLPR